MASQNIAIAESAGAIVTSPTISYEQKALRHGNRQFQQVFSNQYGSPITLSSGQTPVTLNLPPEVFNLYESELLFTVNLGAPVTGAQYIWKYDDTLAEIAHIQFYGANNQWICDLDNLNNYVKIIKREIPFDEYKTLDPLNKLHASNSVRNVVPALRSSEGEPTLPNPSNINYDEPSYFSVGGLASAVSYNVQFPLKLLKNTIFAMNKNLYFNQITYMKIYFAEKNKVCYMSNSNVHPSAGILAAYDGAGTITNLQLMLAIETNPDERAQLINRVQSQGLTMIIPYIQAFKNSNSGTNQNINIQLDVGQGRSLMKMIHSVFSEQESLDTAYDCNNVAPLNTAEAALIPFQKTERYWTQLNGTRIQNLTLDCTVIDSATPRLDYMQQKKSLKSSVLQNANVFQYNWSHCDDWTGFSPEYVQDDQSELISGVAMSGVPITWTFVGNQMVNYTYYHYTYAVFTKRLSISNGQVIVD